MDGQLICMNRTWYVESMNAPGCPESTFENYLSEVERLTDQMRAYWSWRMAPIQNYGDRFRAGIHVCHYCGKIPGSLWTAEDQAAHERAMELSDASWAPTLYYERVMKMGGKWGDDDRIEHNARTAKMYRVLEKAADVIEKYGMEI